MSEKFNGFSQDEIKKYSIQGNQKKLAKSTMSFRGSHGDGIRRMTDKMTSKGTVKKQQVDKIPQQNPPIKNDAGVIINDVSLEDINLDRSMSKSIEEGLFFQPPKKAKSKENIPNNNARGTKKSEDVNANDSSILHMSDKNITSASDDSSSSCIIFDDSSILTEAKNNRATERNENMLNFDSPFKGISLKDFESHRKMIEEQNKQKKEMLQKAIEQYSLKTAAEARKIEEIKSELSKLDNDLALDVAILRKQIDMACMHFANMEKQYMKIESQFLRAKIDLHNAAEKKELLTEHLCTVIAHNEDRKAQKLSELMQKVGLTSAGELDPNEILIKNPSN